MQHAGWDELHNPQGAFLVAACLLILTGIIMGGAFMFRAGQRREALERAALKKARNNQKTE